MEHNTALVRTRAREAPDCRSCAAGGMTEDGAETDNFNFSAARLKTDTHTHKLPRTFMFGNSIR